MYLREEPRDWVKLHSVFSLHFLPSFGKKTARTYRSYQIAAVRTENKILPVDAWYSAATKAEPESVRERRKPDRTGAEGGKQ